MKVYMVEVGVELPKTHKDYGFYYTIDFNGVERSLFDENVVAFEDKDEALSFINEYVSKGVQNTYGFMWTIDREIEEHEMEEFKNLHYLEDEYFSKSEKIDYFKGGIA